MASTTTKRYIAVDLGMDSGKVALATVMDGRVELDTLYSFPILVMKMAGRNYWNIYSIFDEVLKGLAMAGAKKLQIESVGVTSWTSDFVCVAKDGSFIGLPRSSREPYAGSSREKFFKKLSASDYYSITGSQMRDSGTAFQFFAQNREKSLSLENARSILFISDALVYLLTGKKCCEYTQLSAAGLMNVRKGKIARAVLKPCHVKPKRLHTVVTPGTRLSRLTEEVAEATGLGRLNVVVVAANPAVSAVSALPLEEDSSAYLYAGDSAYMGMLLSAPLINDRMLELNMSNESASGGKFLVQKHMPGMRIMDLCLAGWRKEGKDYSPETVQNMLEASSPAVSTLDFDAAELYGRKDIPAAIAGYCTSREMAAPADDQSVMRLIYESFADQCGDMFRKLQGVSPSRLKSVYVFGPYAGDAVLNRMIAEDCAVPVIPVVQDVVALGNVASQAGLSRQMLSKNYDIQEIKPKTY